MRGYSRRVETLQEVGSGASWRLSKGTEGDTVHSSMLPAAQVPGLMLRAVRHRSAMNRRSERLESQWGSTSQRRISVSPQHLLRRALIDCFDLSETERQRLCVVADATPLETLALQESDWQMLESAALTREDSVLCVLCLSAGMLHCYLPSAETFDRVVTSLHRFVEERLARCVGISIPHSVSDCYPVPFRDLDPQSELVLSKHDLPERLVTRARTVALSTWGRASQVSEADVITRHGLSWQGIELIKVLRSLGMLGQGLASQFDGMRARNTGTLESILQPEVLADAWHPREADVVIARLGLRTGEPATLQQIANEYGVTRERIRQIETAFVKRTSSPGSCLRTYRPFWLVVESILQTRRGVVAADTFSVLLAGSLHLTHGLTPKCLQRLMSIAPPELQIDVAARGAQVFVMTNQLPCPGCRVAVRAVTEFLTELGAVSSEALCAHLDEFCRENCTAGPIQRREDCADFLRYLAFATAGEARRLKIAGGTAYLVDAAGQTRFSPATLEMLRTLTSSRGPWRTQDICASLVDRGVIPAAGPLHNASALLAHLPEVLQWDSTTFVHRRFVHVSPVLLDRIENWILGRLFLGAAAVSVRAAYEQFKSDCEEAGLATDLPLYSLLRSHSSLLAFPKYPRVTWRRRGKRVSVALLIEQYIFLAQGPLPIKTVKEHFMKEARLKPPDLFQAVYNNPRLLRYDREQYIHSKVFLGEHPGCEETVRIVARDALALLERGEAVTPARLLARHKDACQSLGVASPEMLASLLSLLAGDLVRVHKGNRVLAATSPATELRPLQKLLCDFVRERGRPVTVFELERHFGKFGYSRHSLGHPLGRSTELVRYAPSTFVHIETLEWNPAKSSQLEALALEEYHEAAGLGRAFALVTSLIQSERLPPLASSLTYTPDCLSDLLARCDSILVLGRRKKNAFLPRQNPDGIRDFARLVEVIVLREFGGRCTLEQLETYLSEYGIIGDRLPKGLFDTTDGL